MAVHDPVRLRLHEPRRGAAADCRGRRHDPHEGRGGDRRHRQRRHPHAGGLRRDSAPPGAPGRRALLRGEGAARAVRPRALGRRERAAARRDVHRRRHRDARRRRALHAARRRRRVRRLRDLQVGRPGSTREGDRRGDDALPRRRRARARLGRARRGRWSASPPPTCAPKSCSKPAAGSNRPRSVRRGREDPGDGRRPPALVELLVPSVRGHVRRPLRDDRAALVAGVRALGRRLLRLVAARVRRPRGRRGRLRARR